MHRRPILFLVLILCLCLSPPLSGRDGCDEEPGHPGCRTSDGPVRTFTIRAPAADFWTERGVLGEPVRALSGERIEVIWQGFFPRYELWYYPVKGGEGRMVGRCHFAGGCNAATYTVKEEALTGRIACFLNITWESLDYTGGNAPYLERFRYVYDVARDHYTVTRDLLHYACPPPLAQYPDSCGSRCEPPYEVETVGGVASPRIFRSTLVEEWRGFVRGRDGDAR